MAMVGPSALIDWLTIILAIASAVLLMHFRLNSVWLVLGGVIIGLAAEKIFL